MKDMVHKNFSYLHEKSFLVRWLRIKEIKDKVHDIVKNALYQNHSDNIL